MSGGGWVDLERFRDALRLKDADDQGTDYVLVGTSCWIEVGDVALWIQDGGYGVNIEAYNSGREDEEPLWQAFIRPTAPAVEEDEEEE